MKIEDLESASLVELKEQASELGIEKLSGMNRAKVLSAVKRVMKKLEKMKEAVAVVAPKVEAARPVKRVMTPAVPKVEPKVEELKLPVFENIQVLRILPDGHNSTHLHCEMANGTYQHVPRYRLVGHGEGL